MTKLLATALFAAVSSTAIGAMQPDQPPEAPSSTTYVQANPRGSTAPAVAAPDPQTAGSPVAPAMPQDPSYHAGPYVGALTPPPPEALNKHYPICHGSVQDNCRNRTGI